MHWWNHSPALTHQGRVTHICVSKLSIIDSDNGLSLGRHQAIIWTKAGILLIQTPGTNISEIFSKIHTFSFKKMHLKMSAKWQQFCLGLNVLTKPLICVAGTMFQMWPIHSAEANRGQPGSQAMHKNNYRNSYQLLHRIWQVIAQKS